MTTPEPQDAGSGSNGPPLTPRQLIKLRARENPPLWPAVLADAQAAAQTLGVSRGEGARPSGLLLVLRMIWDADGFLALSLVRLATSCRALGIPVLPMILRRIAIVIAQVHVGAPVILGPGVVLPHGQVVIDGLSEVGAGSIIRPFVTIGLAEGNVVGPTIGPRAVIGTGAKIFGPVTIGRDVRIGANAVVIDDVADNETVVGIPSRSLRRPTDAPV